MLAASCIERNTVFKSRTKGQLILAPLTRGTHPPFRRLCHSFGCQVTMSEMAYARQLTKYALVDDHFSGLHW
jgi:tRNA-dihydrouridine synthase 3